MRPPIASQVPAAAASTSQVNSCAIILGTGIVDSLNQWSASSYLNYLKCQIHSEFESPRLVGTYGHRGRV